MLDRIAFGTWALGETDWGPIAPREARKVLRTAWEAGIRRFDTAEVYGNGRAEQLVGQEFRREIRNARETIEIAGKSVVRDPRSQRNHLERSLRRCGCEYFDRYYIHWPREGIDLAAAVGALEEARAAGLIREIGVSNVTLSEYRQAVGVAPIGAIQFGYNLIWRRPERQGLTDIPASRRVAYSPLAQGLLARPFSGTPRWDEMDHRRKTPLFSPPAADYTIPFGQRYVAACVEAGFHPAAAAVAWLLGDSSAGKALTGEPHAPGDTTNAAAASKTADPAVGSLHPPRVDEVVVGGRRPAQVTDLVAGIKAFTATGAAPRLAALLEEADLWSTELQQHLPELPNIFGYVPTPYRNRSAQG
jgi:aryl-alcohol dehydrogenase-like predicted oxidoreductase